MYGPGSPQSHLWVLLHLSSQLWSVHHLTNLASGPRFQVPWAAIRMALVQPHHFSRGLAKSLRRGNRETIPSISDLKCLISAQSFLKWLCTQLKSTFFQSKMARFQIYRCLWWGVKVWQLYLWPYLHRREFWAHIMELMKGFRREWPEELSEVINQCGYQGRPMGESSRTNEENLMEGRNIRSGTCGSVRTDNYFFNVYFYLLIMKMSKHSWK